MAAITYPSEVLDREVLDRQLLHRSDRPALRLVHSPAGSRTRRPSPEVLRRRRLVALALLCALLSLAAIGASTVVAAFSGPSAGSPVPTDGPELVAAEVHVVQPGETYWSIAASLEPGDDLRPTVDALVEANGGGPLQAGDRLVLPAG